MSLRHCQILLDFANVVLVEVGPAVVDEAGAPDDDVGVVASPPPPPQPGSTTMLAGGKARNTLDVNDIVG